MSGAGENEGMKKTLLFALALAVIPVGVDVEAMELAQLRALAEQGDKYAQNSLGVMYANSRGVPKEELRVLAAHRGRQNRRRIHTAGKHPIHA
jgi:hypothetical protein